MKKHKNLKIWLCLCIMCNSLDLLAQPGDENADGTLEGNDPTGVPIESNILVTILIIAIIVFCLKKFINSNKSLILKK